MKKLFFVSSFVLSVAMFMSSKVNAQTVVRNLGPITLEETIPDPINLGSSETSTLMKRDPEHWRQVFYLWLDIFLRYGYSANDSIDMALKKTLREIEIYYLVDLKDLK